MTENNKGKKVISEQEVRERLSGKMSDTDIKRLLNSYAKASSEELPDMTAINDLAKRKTETNLLKVSFNLSSEDYNALAKYFEEEGQQGNYLVKKALKEFIKQSTE